MQKGKAIQKAQLSDYSYIAIQVTKNFAISWGQEFASYRYELEHKDSYSYIT